ncbi:MAG TPA: AMP-binding protein [Acetobacteraceae bacterium]|nr:AMP-binding protein [Acetobacteraceae bacterium]
MSAPRTLPGLLMRNAAAMGAHPAVRQRRLGIWQTLSWAEFAALARRFALGLASGGFGPGCRLAVISEPSPEAYAALLAAQSLGGASLPLDPDAEPTALAGLLNAAGISAVLIERREQAEALLAASPRLTETTRLIFQRATGRAPERPGLQGSAAVLAAGEAFAAAEPGYFEAALARRTEAETAILLPDPAEPECIAITHAALLHAAEALAASERFGSNEQAFSYLPLGFPAELVYSLALGLVCGFCCNFPERPDTVPRDLREIGPTFLLAPPRALALLADLSHRAETTPGLKRRAFRRFRAAALRAEALRAGDVPLPPSLRLTCLLGGWIIDRPLRDLLGLRRTRAVYVGPGAPDAEAARLLRSLGVEVRPARFADAAELGLRRARELSHV